MSWLKRPNIFKKKGSEDSQSLNDKAESVDAASASESVSGSGALSTPAADENANRESGGADTPPPASLQSRGGTAGSRTKPLQPTVVEDSESDDHDGAKDRASLASASSGNMYGAAATETPMKLSKPLPPRRSDSADASGDDSAGDDSNEHSDDEDDDGAAPPIEGMYDPAEFENLNVSAEIRELFGHIVRYTPQTIELDTRFKPFIPEYIPAVGDIDAFIKVTRPDDARETLGLNVLDEPAARQSDPSVLELQLRAVSKQSSARAATVKRVEAGERGVKDIDKWIKDISDLHRSKPPPTVHYSRPMPDIDYLMQEWPAEVEDALKEYGIPTADLDCDLSSYVDVCCALLDIPVYKSRVQSLHVLFSLYSAFKASQHFGAVAEDNAAGQAHAAAAGRRASRVERMEL